MSFASDVKNELCRVPIGRHCCAVAAAYGVLLYCPTFTTWEIRIVTACGAFAERLPKLFRRAFGAHFALPAEEKTGGRHVLTITDRADDAARALHQKLEKAGIRTEIDLRNEKIGFKIREARNMKIPYLLVLGDREAQEGTVSVTLRGGHDLGSMPVDALIARMRQEIETKAR